MTTEKFECPPDFESFEIVNSGRVEDLPWSTTSGTKMLIPLLRQLRTKFWDYEAVFERQTIEIIEVGSWAGRNALRMATTFPGYRFYCVDHWKGSDTDATGLVAGELGPRTIFQGFCRNMGEHLFSSVFPCVGSSESWAAIWPRQVAAIYIDAGHDYESVSSDLRAWWPHVLPGGLFFGHDYELFAEVKQAVHDWHTPEFGTLESDDQLWWVWKEKE